MTDHIAEAERHIGYVKESCGALQEGSHEKRAIGHLWYAFRDVIAHLRSTPAAPTRTEEKRFVSGSHVYKHYGVEESPDAEGGEGPSDDLRRAKFEAFQASRGGVVATSVAQELAFYAGWDAHRSSAAREFIDPREVTSVIDGYFPGRVRHSSVAANVLWRLHEVLAEKDRDLAEAKSQLLAQGRIASDLYRSSQAQSGATATLAAEKDRELAELREKVKAWEPTMRSLSPWRGRLPKICSEVTSDLTPVVVRLADAYDAIPAHLRPGSGSDEGKATT